MARFNKFFDRLSRNDQMRARRAAVKPVATADIEAERARARRVYKGVYYM